MDYDNLAQAYYTMIDGNEVWCENPDTLLEIERAWKDVHRQRAPVERNIEAGSGWQSPEIMALAVFGGTLCVVLCATWQVLSWLWNG